MNIFFFLGGGGGAREIFVPDNVEGHRYFCESY